MNTLPWNDDAAQTVTTGSDLHARATSLATAAMEAAASQPVGDIADTDYGRAQARYAADLAAIRTASAKKHLDANNARAAAAAAAKAERQAAHQARLDQAKADAAARKLAKAA
jgi:hypothetical protein